jgi:hypothetical protein
VRSRFQFQEAMENPKRTRRASVRRLHGEIDVANLENEATPLDNPNIASDTRDAEKQEIVSHRTSRDVAAIRGDTDPKLASNTSFVQPHNTEGETLVGTKKQSGTAEPDMKEGDIRSSSRIRNRYTMSKDEKSAPNGKSIEGDKLVRMRQDLDQPLFPRVHSLKRHLILLS